MVMKQVRRPPKERPAAPSNAARVLYLRAPRRVPPALPDPQPLLAADAADRAADQAVAPNWRAISNVTLHRRAYKVRRPDIARLERRRAELLPAAGLSVLLHRRAA